MSAQFCVPRWIAERAADRAAFDPDAAKLLAAIKDGTLVVVENFKVDVP